MHECLSVYLSFSNVSDPDPHGSALQLAPWIRIRIGDADSGSGSSLEMRIPDPDPGTLKIMKTGKN